MRSVRQQVDSQSIDEFIFDTDDSTPEFIVYAFVEWLSCYVANGATFSDGETLQYGFTILRCQVKSRLLRLHAPDFKSMPINWVTDLGQAFQIVLSHKYTPETFGFTPDIPSMNNTAIIGSHFDELPMFLNRLTPVDTNPNDSGWFIGSNREDVDNNDPSRLKLMSLYEAMLVVPHIADYLSLPVGCQIVFAGGHPVILNDYEELEVPKGSYLDQRFNAE